MPSDTPAPGVTTLVKPSELATFHRNARKGDIEAIESSLLVNGQYAPVVGNIGTHTGRPNEILAGNHTLAAFRNLAERNPFDQRWSAIQVHWLDVDDDTAMRIVVADNRTHDAGEGTDDSVVWELLQQAGAEGTGFGETDLEKLEKALGREPEEPPMPNLGPDKPDAPISASITFDSEEQQEIWFGWVRWLRDQYPDPELTVAARVVAHLSDTAASRAS